MNKTCGPGCCLCYLLQLIAGNRFPRIGNAPDGALYEGAVDVAGHGIKFEAVDLASAQAIGKFQLTGGSIDHSQHASA